MGMIKTVGSPSFPIWLLGDSNPKNWQDVLETPLDPRHPARHSIWTPVLDVIQDCIYRTARLRLDTSNLFIRNAIEDPGAKPKGSLVDWPADVTTQMSELQALIREHKPVMLLCFGAFAYEFGRRSLGLKPERGFAAWGASSMGEDFRRRIDRFEIDETNVFPLLHVTIARGKFIQSHNYFCADKGANYFEHVGRRLADVLLAHRHKLSVWI